MVLSRAEGMSDLYEFNPSTLEWRELTQTCSGDPPSNLTAFGVSTIHDKLYIFGGNSKDAGHLILFMRSKHIFTVI